LNWPPGPGAQVGSDLDQKNFGHNPCASLYLVDHFYLSIGESLKKDSYK
jgi:hypothetical protein